MMGRGKPPNAVKGKRDRERRRRRRRRRRRTRQMPYKLRIAIFFQAEMY
jgi:hypothetical protein